MNERGFTLIELLVVISIIGVLSSVVLSSVSLARGRALDAAALQGGQQVLGLIVSCDLEGGKVTVPNSTTNPTNEICTVSGNGSWPRPPQGWAWTQQVWVNNQENLVHMSPVSAITGSQYTQIHCGLYPGWSIYCDGASPGLCRTAQTFSCTPYDGTRWR
jgi:prepilin-type N-terminal cleavage/methylation domain-containing protein